MKGQLSHTYTYRGETFNISEDNGCWNFTINGDFVFFPKIMFSLPGLLTEIDYMVDANADVLLQEAEDIILKLRIIKS